MNLKDVIDWESHWVFTDKSVPFNEQLTVFLQGICQIAKKQHYENADLQIS